LGSILRGFDHAAVCCGSSNMAIRFFTAAFTFSKARTSIWRTRSRDTPNSSASSSSVIGFSASRRISKMRRSRSLSTPSASPSALRRVSRPPLSPPAPPVLRRLVDEPVLPFARAAVVTDRGVEGGVAAEPAVHVDHVPLADAEVLGDQLHLVGAHVALVQSGNLPLRLAQIEEQLLLVSGGAHLHQRPGA